MNRAKLSPPAVARSTRLANCAAVAAVVVAAAAELERDQDDQRQHDHEAERQLGAPPGRLPAQLRRERQGRRRPVARRATACLVSAAVVDRRHHRSPLAFGVAADQGEERVLQPPPRHHPVHPDAGPHQRRHHLGPRRAVDVHDQAGCRRPSTERTPASPAEHRSAAADVGHVELHDRRVADDVVDRAGRPRSRPCA